MKTFPHLDRAWFKRRIGWKTLTVAPFGLSIVLTVASLNGNSALESTLTSGFFILAGLGFSATLHQYFAAEWKEIEAAQSRTQGILQILQAHQTELQRRQADLRTFVHILSDDLNEPLRVLHQTCGQVLEDTRQSLPQKSVGHLQKALERKALMIRLLDDLLLYASVETASKEEEFETRELLREVFQLCSLPEDTQVRIEGQWPRLCGPRAPLLQVFLNLVSNSVRYCSASRPLQLTVSHRESTSSHYFQFKDNGIGIDAKHHDKIFQMFYRVDGAPDLNKEEGGTGIGLAIVRKVVHARGGEVRVTSALEEGAVLEIRWPKKRL